MENNTVVVCHHTNQWRIQDFPEEGALTPRGGGRQPMILSIFAENCMKMKKFWPRGGASLAPPLRSATANGQISIVMMLEHTYVKRMVTWGIFWSYSYFLTLKPTSDLIQIYPFKRQYFFQFAMLDTSWVEISVYCTPETESNRKLATQPTVQLFAMKWRCYQILYSQPVVSFFCILSIISFFVLNWQIC